MHRFQRNDTSVVFDGMKQAAVLFEKTALPSTATTMSPCKSGSRRNRYCRQEDDAISISDSDDSDSFAKPSNIHIFSASSTLHGCKHIFATHHSSLRKFTWTVAFLTSLTFLLLQSTDRVSYYLKFPHVTRIDEIAAGNLSFPSVTICNMNEMRFGQLTKNDMYHAGFLLGFLNRNDELRIPAFYHEIRNMSPPIRSRMLKIKRKIDDLTNFRYNFVAKGPFDMYEFYNRTGHDIKDMLLSCTYRGLVCNHTWFSVRRKQYREEKPSDPVYFATNSTFHGIKYIVKTGKFTVRRTIWLAAFVFSLSCFLYQAQDRYRYYSSHPHMTKLDEREAAEIDFPALTICNVNSFRLTEITSDDYFYAGRTILGLFNENFTIKIKGYRDNRTWDYVHRKIFRLLRLRNKYKPNAKHFDMYEFYNRSGHQIMEMLKMCSYREKNCMSPDYWTPVFTRYGKCYTFNSGLKYEPLKTLKGGIDNGLEVLLDTQQNEYMPVWAETDEISVEAGFKAQLHVQSEPPFIHELGFGVSPGFQTLVATQEQRITFLSSPWGNCVPGIDKSQHFHFKNYSISACRIACETEFVKKNCGCRMVHMPGNASFCTPEEYKACADPALDYLVKKDDQICVCDTPCQVTRYNLETSTLRLPSEKALNYLAYKYGKSEDYVRNNYVKLNIFFEALNYETIEQKVAYEIPGLLGDIGGQMGLFIGASILTILELFNYFYEVVKDKTWGKKLRHKYEGTPNPPQLQLINQTELNNSYQMSGRHLVPFRPNSASGERVQGQNSFCNNLILTPLRELDSSIDADETRYEFPVAVETQSDWQLPHPYRLGEPEMTFDDVNEPKCSLNTISSSRQGVGSRCGRRTSVSYSNLYHRSSDSDWFADEQRELFPTSSSNNKKRHNSSNNLFDHGPYGHSSTYASLRPRRRDLTTTSTSFLPSSSTGVVLPSNLFGESTSVETDIH